VPNRRGKIDVDSEKQKLSKRLSWSIAVKAMEHVGLRRNRAEERL
jgi:hypothetical protein